MRRKTPIGLFSAGAVGVATLAIYLSATWDQTGQPSVSDQSSGAVVTQHLERQLATQPEKSPEGYLDAVGLDQYAANKLGERPSLPSQDEILSRSVREKEMLAELTDAHAFMAQDLLRQHYRASGTAQPKPISKPSTTKNGSTR